MILAINKYFSPDIGGVETIAAQFASALQVNEAVTVLAIKKHFSLQSEISARGRARIIRCASLGSFFSMPISLVFPLYFIFYLRQSRIVHLHEPFPLGSLLFCLWPTKKRLIVSWHSEIVKQKRLQPFFRVFQNIVLKKAEKIIVTSRAFGDLAPSLAHYSKKITVIPPWVETAPPLPQACESLRDLPDQFVLFLGRMSYYKGLDVLAQAIAALPKNIPFVVAGDGDEASRLKMLPSMNGENVTFFARTLDEAEKEFLLQRCKFFVFPSTHNSETFGIIQLEAMIRQKPVINTDLLTGVPFASLHNVSGLTVPKNDADALAAAILHLYDDEEEYERLANGAGERAHKLFSKEVVSSLMEKAFLTKDN